MKEGESAIELYKLKESTLNLNFNMRFFTES